MFLWRYLTPRRLHTQKGETGSRWSKFHVQWSVMTSSGTPEVDPGEKAGDSSVLRDENSIFRRGAPGIALGAWEGKWCSAPPCGAQKVRTGFPGRGCTFLHQGMMEHSHFSRSGCSRSPLPGEDHSACVSIGNPHSTEACHANRKNWHWMEQMSCAVECDTVLGNPRFGPR